ncbi:MAG TPA: alpha/beta fold hydrolase [Burkholderiaceae bacterium]|nr:alpha/beta fold hydrolase [Burkholderiaceae bacterium]
MSDAPSYTHLFTLPGWQGSGEQHWQMRWARLYGDSVVEQHDWMQPLRGDWITRLEDTVQKQLSQHPNQRLAFVAHSLGCHLLAAWAALSPNVQHVLGAFLVAPPDVARADLPPQLHSWRKPALNKLPFKTLLMASTDDPFSSLDAAEVLAAQWGATLINVGARGHINAESGLADWPEGRAMLQSILQNTSTKTTSKITSPYRN